MCATANTTDSDHHLGVVQGLANHDPDVDAFYRLGPRTALPLPFSFASEPPLLVLAPGVVAPFNAQATWWYGPAFGGLMLPATVHGRVSDIWRGYIAQSAMRCDHLRLAFAKPVVEQVRNANDYLKDYMAERPLYEASGALVEALAAVPCAGSLEATIGKAYVVLYKKGFVEREDVARADAFLRDLGRARAAVAPAPARVPAVARPDSAGRPARVYADAAAVALARAGKTGAGGRKEVAIVVMTMDDVPFLSRWLIYHGHVFGFENLYVFDGSRGPQKEYLERVQEQFPINVRHSLANLNQITAKLSAWMDEIKGGYEWMMKVDTDEFVAFAQPNGWPNMSSPNLHLPPGASAELLATDWRAMVAPVQSGSPLESDRAKLDKGVGLLAVLVKGPKTNSATKTGKDNTQYKQIYSGPKFKRKFFNLGSHGLKAWLKTSPGLLIIHYHHRSYEELVRIATQTLISHAYIKASMNVSTKISILAKRDRRPACNMASCHKGWVALDDLRDHEKAKKEFYKEFNTADGQYPAMLAEYRDYLREIFQLYPSVFRPYT